MANISFETSLFSFLVLFLFLFFVLILSVFNSFSFLLSWIFIFSHFFRMSKWPESDWERQKGNLQQTKHGLRQRTKELVSFWRSSGDKNAYLMLSNTPMQFSLTWLANWCASHTSWWSGHQDGFFHWHSDCCYKSITVKVINCGGYYVYHINGTPWCHLRFWNRLNRCWSEKLWILCNRFKNWLHLCVLYFSTLTGSKRSVIGHD